MSLSQIAEPGSELNPVNTFYIFSLTVGQLAIASAVISGNLSVGGTLQVSGATTLNGPVTVAVVSPNAFLSIQKNDALPGIARLTLRGSTALGGNFFRVQQDDTGAGFINNAAGSINISSNASGILLGAGNGSLPANSALTLDASNNVVGKLLTNGQLLIGSTGAAPVSAGLTAGSNMSVVGGAGSITVATIASPSFTSVDFGGSTPLNAYDTATISQTWGGATAPVVVANLQYVLVGSAVNLIIEGISNNSPSVGGGVTSINNSATLLPANIRPGIDVSGSCVVFSAAAAPGLSNTGRMTVTTAGLIQFEYLPTGTDPAGATGFPNGVAGFSTLGFSYAV